MAAQSRDGVGAAGHTAAARYPIHSVDSALELLLLFREHERLSVAETARLLGVAKSTAHRLLTTAGQHGFVDQDPETRDYVVGATLLEFGLAAVARLDVGALARPLLRRLADETGETTHVATLRDRHVLFLAGAESRQMLRAGLRSGTVLPADCTSVGKAMLAEVPTQRLTALYPDNRALSHQTPKAVRTVQALRRQLEAVRRRGFAVNRGESERELHAVAAAVPRPDWVAGTADALAIAITGPASRLGDRRLTALGAQAKAAAAELGQLLERGSPSA